MWPCDGSLGWNLTSLLESTGTTAEGYEDTVPESFSFKEPVPESLWDNSQPNDNRLIVVKLWTIWTGRNLFWIENKVESLGNILQSILNYVEELEGLLDEREINIPDLEAWIYSSGLHGDRGALFQSSNMSGMGVIWIGTLKDF